MGNTVIERGEGSAGVIAPLQNLQSYVHEGVHPGWDLSEEDKWRGVAVSVSGNGGYGKISAYLQGANAAVSAMRKVAAVGAVPRALTDCLNYGNPEIPEELYDFAEGVRGIAEAAKGVKIDGEPVPIISGNVSLYNSTPAGSIPPTAIVSCIGVIPDARKAVSKNIKKGDSLLFLIGDRKDELGKIPEPDYSEVQKQILFMTDAVSNGLLLSSHEIAEGGLLFTLFEMLVPAKRGKVDHGLRVRLKDLGSLSPETLLFTETGGFVFETGAKHTLVLQTLAEKHGLQLFTIGQTLSKPLLEIEGVCSWELSELLRAWDKPLEEKLGL
jgi:phosphoribosylformylglycinamidine synthase